MNISRRKFIKGFSLSSAYILTGGFQVLHAADIYANKHKVALRFAVGSDSHYGQPNTAFDKFTSDFVININKFHKRLQLDACVVNGDIIHDNKEFMPQAKQNLDKLAMPYHVTQGNHDQVSAEYWQQTWGVPFNYEAIIKDNVFLMATTSNEKGEYLSPDLDWLKQKLDQHAQKNIFLFLHIGQQKWTAGSIDNPAYAELIKNYPNVRAVFHGHDHDQDGVKMLGTIPHLYDSHIGGNWGTKYNGYRIVELLKDGTLQTYIMNPLKKVNELQYGN